VLPAGHFDWAPRPDEEVFAETPVPVTSGAAPAPAAAAVEESDDEDDGVPGAADDVPSPLQGADPENTEILVSAWLWGTPYDCVCTPFISVECAWLSVPAIPRLSLKAHIA
jgi:hypothetical protein